MSSGPQMTSDKLHILAFVTHPESGASIRDGAALAGLTRIDIHQGDAGAAATYLGTHPAPDCLLVEVPSAEAAPAMLDMLADVIPPTTKVIITGLIDSLRFYEWLMQLGVHGYLLQPFTPQQFVDALKKDKTKPAEAKADTSARPKKVIAAIGARGGVGVTTLLSAFAVHTARTHKLPTALVDLDAHLGSIALALDLEPGRAMRDIWDKPERIDVMYLERAMVKPFSPLAILSAEETISNPVNTTAATGEALLSACKENYDVIFIDVPRQITPLSLHALAQADTVLVVAQSDVLSLRDALRIKDYLSDALRRSAPKLIVNREGLAKSAQLPADTLAKNSGMPVALRVAYNEEIAATSARGEMLVNNPKLSSALAPLHAFVDTLLGKESAATTPKAKKGIAALLGAK